MINQKLENLLASLNPQEIQRFGLFVKSPYFNKDETIIKWFYTVLPFLHSRNTKVFDELAIWNKTFKTHKNKKTKIAKTNFLLTKLIEEYITVSTFLHDKTQPKLVLLEQLLERNIANQFNTLFSKFSKATNNSSDSALIQFQYYQLENKYFDLIQERNENRNLQEIIELTDINYIVQKLKYWCASLHYGRLNGQQFTIWLEQEISNQLPIQKHLITHPIISIYWHILNLQKETNPSEHYSQLQSKLFKKNNYTDDILKEAFMYIINYCIRKINIGQIEYYNELFTNYQFTLKHNIITNNKKISPWDYKNIVTAAIYVNELDWAQNFINKYSSYLPISESNNAYKYNMGKVFFAKKDFTACLQMLSQTDFTDYSYQLGSKLTQSKALYELQEFETLEDLLISFRKLINRKKKISEQSKTTYKNFISYLTKLTLAKNKVGKKKLLQILELELKVPDKNWLIEKAKQKLIK